MSHNNCRTEDALLKQEPENSGKKTIIMRIIQQRFDQTFCHFSFTAGLRLNRYFQIVFVLLCF